MKKLAYASYALMAIGAAMSLYLAFRPPTETDCRDLTTPGCIAREQPQEPYPSPLPRLLDCEQTCIRCHIRGCSSTESPHGETR